ncbi:iron ABC transporter substrate-binding protein [Pseudomonas sp. PA15(2017)]|uniref:siderophore ABC transporter substrate-binding protein n=1 Tax=Pseudomonas sp. PA15(2017) TaxID=1932111 RepID=UPI00095F59D6|nr:siderophore ABC transporter substrate-binding protein [Pseudomonas sp. PA15(2017)]OLU34885.1 iron ABC transporter substrate-binding protein [Pseudomonas sp. PA15(2017)]
MIRKCGVKAFAQIAVLLGAHYIAVAHSVEITHKQGSLDVPFDPKPTLVFDPGALDTLDTLGVDVQGVGEDNWSGSLEKYRSDAYLKVGTLFEPNYEVVFGAKPQLVIVADRSAPKFRQLADIAPTIDLTVDTRNLVGQVEDNTRLLAKLYQKESMAEAKIKALNLSIAKLHELATNKGTGLIVLTSGGKLSAYGPGSRFGVLHDSFGVQPAATDLKISMHGQVISYEYIAKVDPDWLFVIDRDAALGTAGVAAQQLLDNPIVSRSKAWKAGHVVYLDNNDWYMVGVSGIGALQRTVDTLSIVLGSK